MKHIIEDKGLLLTARYRSPESEYLVVSVGLLVDSTSGRAFTTDESWEWITRRFAGTAFDRGLKKSVGTFAVHGKAFALTEAQRAGMEVRVHVGPREKRLHVFAPRTWYKNPLGWKAVPAGRLESLPLDFENAFGGVAYPDNPDGQGHLVEAATYAGAALAPIESASFPVLNPWEHPPPATFLPLPPQSSARVGFLGTLDEQWAAKRAPWPPQDVDSRWFNEVAQDQCHEHYWRGDETWSVTGMHPHQMHISGVLPGLRPRLFVEYRDHPQLIEEAPLDLDTLWLFPDAERLLLIYRVQIPVSDPDAEDIAALGLCCELRDDPSLPGHTWINRLWPGSNPAETVIAPAPECCDVPAMCNALQASADRVYDEVIQSFEKSIEAVREMTAKMGLSFDPQQFKPPARPDIAAMVGQGEQLSASPFDTTAHEAKIRAALADAEARASEQVEQLIGSVGVAPQVRHAQGLADSQVPLTAMDAAALAARLPLAPTEKIKLQADLASGLTRAKELEADISAKVAAMREQLVLGSTASVASPEMDVATTVNWTREHVQASHEAGQTLVGQRFVGLDLSALDLTAADLGGSHFEKCQLQGTKLNAADMRECVFSDCQMNGIKLQGVRLDAAFFQRCCLDDSELAGASIKLGYAEGSSFVQAQLTQAIFPDGQFSDCDFYKADFTGAIMSGTRFQSCVLDAVCAVDAQMAASQLQSCTADGLNVTGANLQGALWSRVIGREVNASGANLDNLRIDQECQLPDSYFDQANLCNASLQNSNLRGASLRVACLDRAFVSRCDLRDSDGYHLTARGADFTGSDLSGASWIGANLMDASLRKVTLHSADLSGSNLFAAFTDAVRGTQVRLDDALLGRCRLVEDLARA